MATSFAKCWPKSGDEFLRRLIVIFVVLFVAQNACNSVAAKPTRCEWTITGRPPAETGPARRDRERQTREVHAAASDETRLRMLNGCGEGTAWDKNRTLYPSNDGNPVVTMIHPGTHKYPEEAAALIVKFFKEDRRAAKQPTKSPS